MNKPGLIRQAIAGTIWIHVASECIHNTYIYLGEKQLWVNVRSLCISIGPSLQ